MTSKETCSHVGCAQGISAVLLGVKGLLVEDLEMAKGGATVLSEKARDELAANNQDLQVSFEGIIGLFYG